MPQCNRDTPVGPEYFYSIIVKNYELRFWPILAALIESDSQYQYPHSSTLVPGKYTYASWVCQFVKFCNVTQLHEVSQQYICTTA